MRPFSMWLSDQAGKYPGPEAWETPVALIGKQAMKELSTSSTLDLSEKALEETCDKILAATKDRKVAIAIRPTLCYPSQNSIKMLDTISGWPLKIQQAYWKRMLKEAVEDNVSVCEYFYRQTELPQP